MRAKRKPPSLRQCNGALVGRTLPYIFVDPFDDVPKATGRLEIDWTSGSYVAERDTNFIRAKKAVAQLWIAALAQPESSTVALETILLADFALTILKQRNFVPDRVVESPDGGVVFSSLLEVPGAAHYLGLEILNEPTVILSTFRYGEIPTVLSYPATREGALDAAMRMSALFPDFVGGRPTAA